MDLRMRWKFFEYRKMSLSTSRINTVEYLSHGQLRLGMIALSRYFWKGRMLLSILQITKAKHFSHRLLSVEARR